MFELHWLFANNIGRLDYIGTFDDIFLILDQKTQL